MGRDVGAVDVEGLAGPQVLGDDGGYGPRLFARQRDRETLTDHHRLARRVRDVDGAPVLTRGHDLALVVLAADELRDVLVGRRRRLVAGERDADRYAVVVVRRVVDVEVDHHRPAVVERVAQQVEHPLARRAIAVAAHLEAERLLRRGVELENDLDVDLVARRSELRADVVDAQKGHLALPLEQRRVGGFGVAEQAGQ